MGNDPRKYSPDPLPKQVFVDLDEHLSANKARMREAAQALYERVCDTVEMLEQWDGIDYRTLEPLREANRRFEETHPYAARTRTLHQALKAGSWVNDDDK